MHARACKTADIWHTHGLALQALSTARQAERRLTELYTHLGIDVTPLERDEAAVRTLYATVKRGFVAGDLENPEWLRFWGGTFFAIDEVYFEIVQRATADEEPWKVFLDFANSVTRTTHQTGIHEALRSAALRFEAGKRNLLYVSFMFCQRLYGVETARYIFSGKPSAVDELMAILH
jgi:hypothetical protein